MADQKPNLREAGEKDAKARDQALQAAVTQIEKEFGQGALMKLGDIGALNVEAISTGALPLDIALGVGGVPRGRIVEIFGPESSGKTTLVYHIIAEAQARGGVCAFVDTEHALDPVYARKIGVNTDELMISQPDYGEQALEIVDVLVRSGAVDVVAVDSVAALTPRVELEGQMGDQNVGLQARLMSQALRAGRKLSAPTRSACSPTRSGRRSRSVCFPETQPGVGAEVLALAAADIRRIETSRRAPRRSATGSGSVVKNRRAPFRQAEFDIEYGVGISKEGAVIDMALEHDLIQKSGSFFSYGETRLGQGRNNTKEFLRDNPELAAELEKKIHAKLGIGDAAEAEARPEAEKEADAAKAAEAVKATKKPEKKAA
jgi:recombination protein RecA